MLEHAKKLMSGKIDKGEVYSFMTMMTTSSGSQGTKPVGQSSSLHIFMQTMLALQPPPIRAIMVILSPSFNI